MGHRQRERVVKGSVSSEHLVQLFDDSDSLATTVSDFLYSGWLTGQTLLVVARPDQWAVTSRQMVSLGCPVADAIASGRLVVLDAATALASFTRNGFPRAELFDDEIGSLVRALAESNPAGLRIYGEMVDILAARADLAATEALERLWNDLGAQCSFTLLCGYSSANFADERTAAALQSICAAHTHTRVNESDLLGSWLLSGRRPRLQIAPG